MSWNIKTPGDYINGPLTVAGVTQFNSNVAIGVSPGIWVANRRVLEIGGLAASALALNGTAAVGEVFANVTRDTAGTYRYAVNGPAGYFDFNNSANGWSWSVAAAGTAGNSLVFSPSMTLTTTGLGLGVNPTTRLHVLAPDATTADLARFQQTNQGNLLIQSQQGSQSLGGANGILFSNATGRMGFRTNASSGDAQVVLESSGNVLIGSVVNNANGGCLQLKSGITLPAAQVASTDANTLDDYEEGTWTPAIAGTSPVGTGTYSFQGGRYTKVGNRVFVEGYIAWSAHTGGGTMSISGLPFAVGAVFYCSGSIGDVNNIGLTAGNTLALVAISSSLEINMRQLPVGGGVSALVPLDTNANISFSICYTV